MFAIGVSGMMIALISICIVIHLRYHVHDAIVVVLVTYFFVCVVMAFGGIVCHSRMALVPWILVHSVGIVVGLWGIYRQIQNDHLLHASLSTILDGMVVWACVKTSKLLVHWQQEQRKQCRFRKELKTGKTKDSKNILDLETQENSEEEDCHIGT